MYLRSDNRTSYHRGLSRIRNPRPSYTSSCFSSKISDGKSRSQNISDTFIGAGTLASTDLLYSRQVPFRIISFARNRSIRLGISPRRFRSCHCSQNPEEVLQNIRILNLSQLSPKAVNMANFTITNIKRHA